MAFSIARDEELMKPLEPEAILSRSRGRPLLKLSCGLRRLHHSLENPVDLSALNQHAKIPIEHAKASLLNDRYQVLDEIGTGAFAQTFLCLDTYASARRTVAVKVMNSDQMAVGMQEAAHLQAIQNKFASGSTSMQEANVMELFETFIFSGRFCLALEPCEFGLNELMPGKKLDMFHSESGHDQTSARLQFIREICFQVVQGLLTLKVSGLIHADIKPDNIMVQTPQFAPLQLGSGNKGSRSTPSSILGRVRIVDLGNAIPLEYVDMYTSDFKLQALAYRAPEVLFGCRFGFNVDMWSLGCVLFELYHGKPFVDGRPSSTHDLFQQLQAKFGTESFSCLSHGKFYGDLFSSKDSDAQPSQDVKLDMADASLSDFVKQCLSINPSNRLVPETALEHPFLAQFRPRWITTERTSMLKRLGTMTAVGQSAKLTAAESASHLRKLGQHFTVAMNHRLKLRDSSILLADVKNQCRRRIIEVLASDEVISKCVQTLFEGPIDSSTLASVSEDLVAKAQTKGSARRSKLNSPNASHEASFVGRLVDVLLAGGASLAKHSHGKLESPKQKTGNVSSERSKHSKRDSTEKKNQAQASVTKQKSATASKRKMPSPANSRISGLSSLGGLAGLSQFRVSKIASNRSPTRVKQQSKKALKAKRRKDEAKSKPSKDSLLSFLQQTSDFRHES